jgi:hypothetical protein
LLHFTQCQLGVDALAFQTMFEMVVNELTLGTADSLFHGMKLLREFKARAVLLEHGDYSTQVAFGPPEPFQNSGVALVLHGIYLSVPQ